MKKSWIASAIEDLQRMAIEHQMQSIAFALDDVMEIAEREIVFEQTFENSPQRSSRELTESSILQFPTSH